MTLLPAPDSSLPADAELPPRRQAGSAWHWQPLRGSGVPLVEQLVTHVEGLVRSHGLRAGMRLPSVRQLAQDSGVSRDTVVQAYDRLAALGLVHSRRGAGFFVSALRNLGAPQQPLEAAMRVAAACCRRSGWSRRC
nr:winged helix-turn-helix domain-containing protein [Comamonas terrigena]